MAYQVFDSVVRALSKPGVPLSDMERIEELGHLVSAPTIAALEEKLGIPAGRLERTVEAYNESVSGRHGDRFGRTGLVNGVGALVPVTAPPFYAYPAVTAMTSTFGGVSVAPDTSVKRIDGTPHRGAVRRWRGRGRVPRRLVHDRHRADQGARVRGRGRRHDRRG